MKTRNCTLIAALASLMAGVVQLHSQGTAFTYQGRLNEGSVPANGRYDLTFALYVDSAVGSAVSGIITNTGTPVANGLFTVTLDFGAGAFDGRPRWLEIGVQRAIGATPRMIISQIMLESVVLTTVSGYIGLAFGVGLLELVNKVMENSPTPTNDRVFFTNPSVSLTVALSSLFVLVLAGLLAGLIPASRAMQIKPIDALREE